MSRSMVRSFVFSLVFIFVLAVTIFNTGCVGVTAAAPAAAAQSTQTAVSISISPQTVSLATGGSQQFTATVSGTSNTAVNWAASGGSIIGTGDGVVYTAPTTAGNLHGDRYKRRGYNADSYSDNHSFGDFFKRHCCHHSQHSVVIARREFIS